jgi:hypothetical protein
MRVHGTNGLARVRIRGHGLQLELRVLCNQAQEFTANVSASASNGHFVDH